MSNLTIYGGLIAIDKGLGVVYTAGGISSDCVEGFFEAEANIMLYTTFMTTPSLLYWNLVYNFGLLYNSVKSVIYFFFIPASSNLTTN